MYYVNCNSISGKRLPGRQISNLYSDLLPIRWLNSKKEGFSYDTHFLI
jgi:hypothetical protein